MYDFPILIIIIIMVVIDNVLVRGMEVEDIIVAVATTTIMVSHIQKGNNLVNQLK